MRLSDISLIAAFCVAQCERDNFRGNPSRGMAAEALGSTTRPFVIYSFRHTFLTRLGESGCDAWTLARIAGHSNIAISQRYVHPSGDAVLLAMSRPGGHNTEHTEKTALPPTSETQAVRCLVSGLGGERGRNRTFNLLIKSQLLCQLSYAPLPWNRSDEGHHRKQYQCNTGLLLQSGSTRID
jgi:hypothetical protein